MTAPAPEALASVIESALDERCPLINLSRGEYEAVADIAAKAALSPAGQAAQRPQCKGFVPRSGFGANRTCSICGQPYESHPVRVQ